MKTIATVAVFAVDDGAVVCIIKIEVNPSTKRILYTVVVRCFWWASGNTSALKPYKYWKTCEEMYKQIYRYKSHCKTLNLALFLRFHFICCYSSFIFPSLTLSVYVCLCLFPFRSSFPVSTFVFFFFCVLFFFFFWSHYHVTCGKYVLSRACTSISIYIYTINE